MKCCASHGLPIDCLEQKLDSKSSSHHNSTHMVITTIISKECHNYKSILEECKDECINEGHKTNSAKRTHTDHLKIEDNELGRLKGEIMDSENQIVRKLHTENKISAERIRIDSKYE